MTALKFRKRPVVIEAMQYDGTESSLRALSDWAGLFEGEAIVSWLSSAVPAPFDVQIITLEGPLRASEGDWIIKGVQGEFYPCKPEIFAATYDDPTLMSDGTALLREARSIFEQMVKDVEDGDLVIDDALIVIRDWLRDYKPEVAA